MWPVGHGLGSHVPEYANSSDQREFFSPFIDFTKSPIKFVEYAQPQKTLNKSESFFCNALLSFAVRLFPQGSKLTFSTTCPSGKLKQMFTYQGNSQFAQKKEAQCILMLFDFEKGRNYY